MYYPKSFNMRQAITAAELVLAAYHRFEAYKSGQEWQIPAGYKMLRELTYRWPIRKQRNKSGDFLNLNRFGITRTDEYDGKDIPIGFILEKGHTVYLIFRGTMTAGEWLLDATTGLVPGAENTGILVHEGFSKTYNVFCEEIIETFQSVPRRKKIVIAGHSLGAALATLAVADVAASIPAKNISIYTFGSPRVGNADFVHAYNAKFGKRTFRIFNTADLVVAVPPPMPIVGVVKGFFTHVDTPVVFTTQMGDVEKNHIIETYLAVLQKHANQQRWFFRPSSKDLLD